MKDIFQEIIKLNMMEDTSAKNNAARNLFDRLNSMELPRYFNWTADIFEELHVKKTPDKKALIWTDLDTLETKRYQLVKAYVILNPALKASKELALELFKHTITILPKFKIPRIPEFVPEVPKTISGKIRRVELRHIETARQEKNNDPEHQEYFYWDFPELSAKKITILTIPVFEYKIAHM